jgi:hypothetical protein
MSLSDQDAIIFLLLLVMAITSSFVLWLLANPHPPAYG